MKQKTIFGRVICSSFAGLVALIFFALPEAHAGVLPESWSGIFDLDLFVQPGDGTFVEEIRRLFYDNILLIFQYLFAFIALLVWVIYIVILLASAGNEETVTAQRKNFAWGILGMVVIALAVNLGDVFTPLDNGEEIIDQSGAKLVFTKIVALLQMGITIISIATIFYAGFMFIRSNGEEEQLEKGKKYLTWSLIGIVIAVLSVPLVNNVFYPADQSLGQEEIEALSSEVGGLLRFFLTFLGVGAMATLVAAGYFYVTSFGDDERQEKAKNIIIGTLVGIVIILSSIPIVALFVPSL